MNDNSKQTESASTPEDRSWLASKMALRGELQFSLSNSGEVTTYLVEDPIRSRFYQVGQTEFAFMSLLDGKRTVEAALNQINGRQNDDASDEQPVLEESDGKKICSWLVRSCLVNCETPAGTERLVQTARQKDRQKWISWLNPICIRLSLFNPHRFLTRLGNVTSWLFTPWFFMIWCLVAVIGIVQVGTNWERLTAESAGILVSGRWFWLLLGWIGLKVIHEAAHGVVCRKYGGDVRQAGVLFLLFAPLAFVDVTSSWRFRNRAHRIYVAAAGMYIELLVASLAIIVWSQQGSGMVSDLCYNLFLMASITTLLFNANPLMRFDGYYMLSDLLGIVNLYSKGQIWFRNAVQNLLLGIPMRPMAGDRSEKWMVRVYGIAAFVWRILLSASLLLAASAMFDGFGLILAGVGAIFWIGLPALQTFSPLWKAAERHLVDWRRFGFAALAMAGIMVGVFFVFRAPAYKSAPAIVQFKDEQVVRAATDGFIDAIHIANGESVEKNQLLVTLTNPKIALELKALQIEWEQAKIQTRIFREREELSKYLAEQEKCLRLETQIAEASGKLAQLEVRAPAAGIAFQPDLENWTGSFVNEGDPLLTVFEKRAKEIRVSIDQTDLDSVKANVGEKVTVIFPGLPMARCTLDRLDPRASDIPLHPSLTANHGGPLAVRPVDDSTDETAGKLRLLSPRFTATLGLPAELGMRFRGGQRGSILIRASERSLGSYLFLASRNWIRKKLRSAMGY